MSTGHIEQYWLGAEPYFLVTYNPTDESVVFRTNLFALGLSGAELADSVQAIADSLRSGEISPEHAGLPRPVESEET